MKYLIILFMFLSVSLVAQDGETLFKTQCASCHRIDKDMVGPKLMGVRAKWEEAGELEFLYEWIADPIGLVESGKSNLAMEMINYSPSDMEPMAHLSQQDIDAILAYADEQAELMSQRDQDEIQSALDNQEGSEKESEEKGTEAKEKKGDVWIYVLAGLIIVLIIILMITKKKGGK